MRNGLFRKALIYGIILLFFGSGVVLNVNVSGDGGEDIELDFSFDEPTIENITINATIYDRVILSGLSNSNIPGEPCLPMQSVNVLIPQNYTVEDINVTVEGKTFLNGSFFVEPGQRSYPFSYNWSSHNGSIDTKPNMTIYNSSQHYPYTTFQSLSIQKKRGYHILFLNIYPVRYIPNSQELYYYKNMNITISLISTEPNYENYRGLTEDKNMIEKMVDNPEAASRYPLGNQNGEIYEYVIITNATFANAFENLTNWKETRGKYTEYTNLSTQIVLVENIIANSSFWNNGYWGDHADETVDNDFNDTQCQIRNFIKMAYNRTVGWSTEYVLLGGDGDGGDVGGESGDDIIPTRYLYSEYEEFNIPADMYYGCLDGNWDNDSDGRFGESSSHSVGEEADFFAEVYIGRSPVDNVSEVWNFVNKTIAYENTSIDDSYLRKALFVGEYLRFGGPIDFACESMEEIRHGSDNHGYTTEGIYKGYTIDFLYDKLYFWDKSELISRINSNVSIINHLGHGNNYHVMKLDHPVKSHDLDDLTNTHYFFVYSQACFSGSFDNWWPYPQTYKPNDSIGEHLVTGDHGAFAAIMNSRFGYGRMFSTDGPSQQYNREFWDAISNESIIRLSEANQDSKEDNIIRIHSGNVMRTICYGLNLLGDPETQIKNFSNPEADIKSPMTSDKINGLITQINGTATANDFCNYSVFYKQGIHFYGDDGLDWIQLCDSDNEVIDDALCNWDISSLNDGYYTLKLKINNLSHENEDRIIIRLQHVTIPGSWISETVDSSDNSRRIDIAVDNQNRPHIIYGSDGIIFYAWRDINGSWHNEQLEDTYDSSISINLDSDDNPYIIYYNNNGLCYAYWNGFSWNYEIIDPNGSDKKTHHAKCNYCCIKLNSTDIPHVSYRCDSTVNYAYLKNGAWDIIIIDPSLIEEERDGASSLAFDSNDNPYICYEEGHHLGTNYIKYVYWDGNNWQNENIDEATHGDLASSGLTIDINNSDVPHIVYNDPAGFLIHAWKNSSGWQKENARATFAIAYPSMVIDDYDFIQIAYTTSAAFMDFDLGYIRYNDNQWIWEDADADYDPYLGFLAKIAVDSNQLPHIIHYSAYSGTFRYVYLTDISPNAPHLIFPANNATIQSSNVVLKVFISDPENDSMNLKFIDNKTGKTIGCLNNRPSNSNQSIVWDGIISSMTYEWYVIANDTIYENQSEVWTFTVEDTESPEITNVSNTPNTVGFGFNVDITADATDNLSDIYMVKVNITYPDDSSENSTMSNTDNSTYEYVFSDTWLVGQYNYTIWAIDKAENGNSSSGHSFNVSANATISISTLKDSYGSNEYINITDPPSEGGDGGSSSPIGYELLDDNTVLHIWNRFDNYYFNVSSGIQLTNHYNEYWSHNVLMLGYYDDDAWNLIYRTDDLSGFNRNIDSDNETFVNATLWKDLSYGAYDFRLALRYCLGVNDSDLTIIPYIKNLGIAIPYTLGFGWEIKDIKIDDTYENDQIRLNDTSYFLNQTLDNKYTNLTHTYQEYNETYTMPTPSFFIDNVNSNGNIDKTLYLKWNHTLDYLVTVKSRVGQYNAPVTLFIKVGTLDVGQEKSTELHWLDSDTIYDFSTGAGVDKWAYKDEMSGNDAPNILFTTGNYLNIAVDDGTRQMDSAQTDEYYAAHRFVFTITEADPTALTAAWNGIGYHDSETNGATLYIWNFNTVEYEELDTTTSSMEQTLTATLTSNLGDYIDINDMVIIIVVQNHLTYADFYSNIETDYVKLVVTSAVNNVPVQSGEIPSNTSTGISVTPQLYVLCTDVNNDNMNATWWSNSSGSWQQFASNSSASGFANNTNITQTNSNFSANSTKYWWSVNLTDGIDWTNETYHFTTYIQSKIENTGSTNISGYLLMHVQFWNETIGEWVVDDDTVNETTPRVINSSDQLALDTIFNVCLVNTNDLSYGNGTYRVYAAFRDPDGNILKCDDETELVATYEFDVTFE